MRGIELLTELSEATGLPDELIGEELSRLVATTGKTTDEITLDELRELLGSYLQDVLINAKGTFDNEASAKAEMQKAAEIIRTAFDND
jgi:hypothetical protein